MLQKSAFRSLVTETAVVVWAWLLHVAGRSNPHVLPIGLRMAVWASVHPVAVAVLLEELADAKLAVVVLMEERALLVAVPASALEVKNTNSLLDFGFILLVLN